MGVKLVSDRKLRATLRVLRTGVGALGSRIFYNFTLQQKRDEIRKDEVDGMYNTQVCKS